MRRSFAPADAESPPRRWRAACAGWRCLRPRLFWECLPDICFAQCPSPASIRAVINPPPNQQFRLTSDLAGPPVLSPDGSYVAFTAVGSDGKTNLWVRPMNGADARTLPDTNDAIFPFWSPDSRSLGFFANGKLRTIDLNGTTRAGGLRRATGARRRLGSHRRHRVLAIADLRFAAGQRQRGLSHAADKVGHRRAFLPPLAILSSRRHTFSVLRHGSQPVEAVPTTASTMLRWTDARTACSFTRRPTRSMRQGFCCSIVAIS